MTATCKARIGSYASFLEKKTWNSPKSGLDVVPDLHDKLFPFQRDIVAWALRKGRACVFADCGLGKTFMQLEWARHVPGDVLILSPLAVAQQTKAEGDRFGIESNVSRDGIKQGKITITNYEQLHKFDPREYAGVVLDESSIIKSYSGMLRNQIIESFSNTPFRLACTATPAPNDHMELGNHAEFMGVMRRNEMLAMFFIHDGGNTSQWRLKGHAVDRFWKWVATWAVMLKSPADLGYSGDGFDLPGIEFHKHYIPTGIKTDDELFSMPLLTMQEQRGARRKTLDDRVRAVADIINGSGDPWIVWCELNDEGTMLEKLIEGSVQVAGADTNEVKEDRLMRFVNGDHKILISKPKIAGFGMNWQHCHNMAFVGLSHSYEQFYQAIRRCWRFGQDKKVNVHIITTDIESAILDNIERKKREADTMAQKMIENMQEISIQEMQGAEQEKPAGRRTTMGAGDGWTMHLGDCVDVVGELEKDSIDYTIFSPPFASLYTYSDSTRDMGNCTSRDEFAKHFTFIVSGLLKVTKPGRLLSFHCMQLPLMKERDGFIGLHDFRGELIKIFTDAGWIYHSEVCIWKDPVTQMQRTKALGLLHKQIRKDSTMCRQGLADYLVTMRCPGENPDRVGHTHDDFPVNRWQRWASPIWTDIDPSDTIQYRGARENNDERHIAPLQLGVISRAIRLWTAAGDLVLSPFAGVGSEGYAALREGRMFVGIELKESYWKQACINLKSARSQAELFGE